MGFTGRLIGNICLLCSTYAPISCLYLPSSKPTLTFLRLCPAGSFLAALHLNLTHLNDHVTGNKLRRNQLCVPGL